MSAESTLRSFVSSVRKFHGECSVSCRPGCAMDVEAAEAAARLLDDLHANRAMVRDCRDVVAECRADLDGHEPIDDIARIVGYPETA